MRRSVSGTGYRISCRHQLISLASVGAVFLLVMGSWVATAKAAGANVSGDSFASLRDYVQVIAAAPAPTDAPKLAAADNLVDFLRGLQNGNQNAAPPASAPARARGPAVAATFIGSQACAKCHGPLIAAFNKTLMGKIGLTQKGKFECENCHGPGSAHVAAGGGRGVGGILSFEKDDPRPIAERNGICLNCHQRGERTYWAGSVHESRGLACTNCHTIMKAVTRKHQLKKKVEAEVCYQCHKLKRAQMQYSSHMPVRENKITCSNCHNPHGSTTENLIRQASVNENCYTCHAEKRGPRLWEHAPVRENCLNCHNPHGSNYENLLKVARPRLCHECHSMAHSTSLTGGFGSPNQPYVLGRACGNCHSNIHGSNHPNGMFFLR
jgi:DmsE family decaheme c-type cytochrome